MNAALHVKGITVAYGGVRAVDDVGFSLNQGESIGIVGPNGSGKTSLLNALTGLTPCSGSMSVDTHRVPLGHPVAVHRAGIARTFQTPQVYDELSCLDNALLTTQPGRGAGLLGAVVPIGTFHWAEKQRLENARLALDRMGLAGSAERKAEGLSYGLRRHLELARALAGKPLFLLLDEPSAGLNEEETDALADILLPIRAEGVGIVVVDHKVGFLDRLCQRLLFLQQGRVITTGLPSEVWSDDAVIDAYLGTRASHA